jgi:hypothetical protein
MLLLSHLFLQVVGQLMVGVGMIVRPSYKYVGLKYSCMCMVKAKLIAGKRGSGVKGEKF